MWPWETLMYSQKKNAHHLPSGHIKVKFKIKLILNSESRHILNKVHWVYLKSDVSQLATRATAPADATD